MVNVVQGVAASADLDAGAGTVVIHTCSCSSGNKRSRLARVGGRKTGRIY